MTPPFARPWICAINGSKVSERLKDELGVDEILVVPPSSTQTVDLAATFRGRNWAPVDIMLDCSAVATLRPASTSSVVKDRGLVFTLGEPWQELENTASRGQDTLGTNDSSLRSEHLAATPDGAGLAQIVELVEANVVTVGKTTIVDLVDAIDFVITGAEEASSSLIRNETVIRVN